MFNFHFQVCDVTGMQYASIDSIDVSYFVTFTGLYGAGNVQAMVQVGKFKELVRHDYNGVEVVYPHMNEGKDIDKAVSAL